MIFFSADFVTICEVTKKNKQIKTNLIKNQMNYWSEHVTGAGHKKYSFITVIAGNLK